MCSWQLKGRTLCGPDEKFTCSLKFLKFLRIAPLVVAKADSVSIFWPRNSTFVLTTLGLLGQINFFHNCYWLPVIQCETGFTCPLTSVSAGPPPPVSLSARRKSKQALRDYKKVQIQLENLETSVRDRCKKEFTGESQIEKLTRLITQNNKLLSRKTSTP